MKKVGTKLSRGEANLVKALESLFPQKSTGGQLLATAASFIPGFGPVISPVVSMVDGMIDQNKAQKDIKKPVEIAKVNSNPFGKLALGGGIQNQGFKQYNTGSHLTGNDQTVNEAGTPSGVTPVASIQNKENMFMVNGKPFVMSDVLVNPKTGNTINVDAAKLNKKLSNAAYDPEQKNALKFGMKKLATINDSMKMMQEATQAQAQMYNGGDIPPANSMLTDMWNGIKKDGSQMVDFGTTFFNEGSKVGGKLVDTVWEAAHPKTNTFDNTMTNLKELGNQAWNSGVAIKDKYNSYQKFGGGELGDPQRRVRIENGKPYEYNLISDAPQDLSTDPLSATIPLATNPLNITTNDSFIGGNFQTNEPDPLAMNTSGQYPNNPEIKLGQNLTPMPNSKFASTERGPTTQTGITPPTAKDPYNNWANKVAIGLKGVALAKSFADTLRKAEEETPILPNYEKSDRYMQEANIDYTQARQDALGASNIGANMNRSASNNFSSFQGREQARVANLMDSLGGISQQENNARSQLNLTRGQYEQQKATDTANRLSQNRIDNFQNLSVDRLADEKFFTELSQVGSEFNKYNNFRQQLDNNKDMQQFYIKEGLMMINQGNPNFKVSDDFVERMQAGESWDNLVKFYPDDAQAFAEGMAKSKSTTTTTTTYKSKTGE